MLPSGAPILVLTRGEAEWVQRNAALYAEQFGFQNVSDLNDLDGIIRAELMLFRWELWQTRGRDYHGRRLTGMELETYARLSKERQTEVRHQKKQLQLDATTRSKVSGKGSPAQWFDELLDAAHKMAIHRNMQAALAIELAMDLISRAQFIQKASPEEQRIVDITEANLVQFIVEEFAPRFMELDEKFQMEEQQYWVQAI